VNADPIARWYRWLEYLGFGGALERRRFAFLKDVAGMQRALVLGEGDGRFLAKLVEQNVHASIDYVDLSEQMLVLARERSGADRVSYHHANALDVPLPDAEYDLIVTHFFLDCLNKREAAALIEKIALASKPGAQWIISEFREPGAWAHAMVSALYFFFRITTGLRTRRLIDHRPLLAGHGFVLQREETERFGLLASERWVFGDNKFR
jgi:ubiquinone/menaquinone biosynthesis C-methylase UbiE